MAINNPPLKSPPCVLADWVEMRTLADPDNFFRLSKLKRFWDTQRETEDSDPSGLHAVEVDTDTEGASGEDDDSFISSITDELADRENALKDSYPFVFESERFKLKDNLSEGAYIYLFCLLISHWKADEILNGSWVPEINNAVRDLFQACSTLAAAGFVFGCSISFGWPRPNENPAFLAKLNEVYAIFGEGIPVNEVPAGASPYVKDSEIDIIAWKPRPDNAAGTFYMLGQVASGDNWEHKSISGGSVKYFHETWFQKKPSSEATPSIFIPQTIEEKWGGKRNERIAQETHRYGIIIDRLILPFCAKIGIDLKDSPLNTFHIERRDEITHVKHWVDANKVSLQAAGAVPL
jgi:hypothetical protein